MTPAASAAICRAATKAVLIWIVFYVLLLHGFVVWKWDSVSITIDPSVWKENNKSMMNSESAAIKVSDHEKQRLERRVARKDELRAQQQAARQQERDVKKEQARNERKEAFLQAARSTRAEERARRLQEKKAAAIEAGLQERQAQRAIRKEQALVAAAESRAARQAAYQQALAERAAAREARKQARRLERVNKARIEVLAAKRAAREVERAAAAHKRANSTIQQVQEEEQLRAAIHAQEATIDTQEAYVRALAGRLQRVSEARARLVQENRRESSSHMRRQRLDLEQALQQQIDQMHPSLSTSGTVGDSPHQLDPLVAWLRKQVEVQNDEEEETMLSSDLLLLHPSLDDLKQQFDYIDSVLQDQIHLAARVDWQQIHEVLRNEYPSKESIGSGSSRTALYCSHAREAAVLAKMSQESSNADGGGRHADFISSASNLAQRLEAAVTMHNATTLDQMVDQVPIYFAETYNNIYAKLDAAMESWLERVAVTFREYEEQLKANKSLVDNKESSSSAEVNESGNCVSMDQIHELLRDGLDALNGNQDLRQALLHSMSMLHMNVSSIILDAMLPGDDNNSMQQQLRDDDSETTSSSATTRSLREFLDRPVTHEMATWVNLVLDMISGHVDGVDRFLDENIPAGVDVGEYVVHRLLQLAGTYGDRNVMARIGRIIPKKLKQSFR